MTTAAATIARLQNTPGAQVASIRANTTDANSHAQQFIARWQGVALTVATERSTSQTFVLELCALLGVPTPLPNDALDYVFERPITFAHGDGSTAPAASTATGAATSCGKAKS